METCIREYNEGAPVEISKQNEICPTGIAGIIKIFKGDNQNDRLCIVAYNEGGYSSTCVDLLDVLQWCKDNNISL